MCGKTPPAFSASYLPALLLFSTCLPAQQPPRLEPRDPHQLTFNVVVTGRSGSGTSSLHPADFVVLDNNSPASQLSIQPAANIELLVVLDAINTSHEDLAHAEDELRALLTSRGPRLARPLSILLVSDSEPKPKPGASTSPSSTAGLAQRQAFVHRIPASTDVAALIKALNESDTGLRRISDAQAGEGEANRVRLSLQALDFIATAQVEDPARKILVWISPGWPLLARSGARTSDQLFETIVYFSGLLQEAHITLNAISPAGISRAVQAPGLPPPQVVNGSTVRGGPTSAPSVDTTPALYEDFFKPTRSPRQASPNDLALQVLAHQTGGLVSPPGNTIQPMLARCLAQADALYVLSYTPPSFTGSLQFHDLAVKIARPALEIHSPIGYYAR